MKQFSLKNSLFVMLLTLLSFTGNPLNAQNTLNRIGLTSAAPSATAYSLRLLSSTYTGPLIRIQLRVPEYDGAVNPYLIFNTYFDVYPDKNGVLSSNSPISVNVETPDAPQSSPTGQILNSTLNNPAYAGTVVIWYDQSGNAGRNMTQNNTLLQPTILENGKILQYANGRPYIRFWNQNFMNTQPGIFFPAATTVVATATGITASPSILLSKCGDGGKNLDIASPFDFTRSDGLLITGNGHEYQAINLATTNPRSDISNNTYGTVFKSFAFVSKKDDTTKAFFNGFLTGKVYTTHYVDFGNAMYIGGRNDGRVYGSMYVSEIVTFNAQFDNLTIYLLSLEQSSFVNATFFTSQPSPNAQTGCVGFTAKPLNIELSDPKAIVRVKWYKSQLPSPGPDAILVGDSTASYTPPTTSPGTYYYFARVYTGPTAYPIYSAVSGPITVQASQPSGNIVAPKSLCVGARDTLLAPPLPTGGVVSQFGNYRVHTFKQSGVFHVPPGFKGKIELLIVGGGGGGGNNGGGGGGAGGITYTGSYTLNDTSGKTINYNVIVGKGGAAGTKGQTSAFNNIPAFGGGGGASRGGNVADSGASGGGGAGGKTIAESIGGKIVTTFGRQGMPGSPGTNPDLGCNASGGGGGGYAIFDPLEMLTKGVSGASGNGGPGVYIAIDGSAKPYAAGGAGGRTCNDMVLGKGGSNIGGNGGGSITLATDGATNTGSGGGGGGSIGQGGNGSSGIVIIRYVNDITAKWRSSNPSIIAVDSIKGIVKALALGTATISLNSSDCNATPSTVSITVYHNAGIALVSAAGTNVQTKCAESAITNIVYGISLASTVTVDNLPPGITYSLNSIGTLLAITGKPLNTASGIYNYTVNITTGCSTTSATGTITVNALPSITLISGVGSDAQTACLNRDINTISYALTGATSVFATGLPVGITGAGNIGFTLETINGKPSALTVASTYTISISGACGSITKSGTIAVIPAATIALTSATATTNQTKFIGSDIDNITFNSTLATGASVTGLPAGVTGVWANNAITIAGTPTQTGNFFYTVNAIGGGVCSAIASGSIIVKALSTDATLSNLSSNNTNSFNPIFSSGSTAYTISVSSTTNSITLTTTSSDAYASISINGVAVVSGVTSQAIALNSGSNTATIVVTAQDGVTTKTYTININKAYPIPAITYTNPQTYDKGSAIAPLSPTNTGGNVALPASFANITTFAGNGNVGNTNGTATNARFYTPTGVAIDVAGNVYVADGGNGLIRKIIPTGTVSTIVSSLSTPYGVVVQNSSNLYASDFADHTIYNITPAGIVSVFAGRNRGSTNATGTGARFNNPGSIVLDSDGNIFVADAGNNRIRKITPAAVVTTFAGSSSGYKDATGTNAQFNNPQGIAVDKAGNLYVADGDNNRIRKITTAGVVSTIAGSGVAGNADGVGTAASFNKPLGIAIDSLGNMYIADGGNNSIRKISTTGVVTTLAGISGISASIDGLNNIARFKQPTGITIDNVGNAYIADQDDNKIRKMTIGGGYSISPALPQGLVIDATTGIISGTPTVTAAAKNYTITAANETGVSTAIVNITVSAGSNNANLNNLVLSAGTLAPSFASATTAYAATVNNAITIVTVTPTVADTRATIQVRVNNGTYAALASASTSAALSLNVGLNPIDITVTAQDGTTIKTYTILVTRVASSNANLSSLSTTAGLLSPTFAAATTAYATSVNNATTSITVIPTKFDANASIQVRVNGSNYSTITSGVASSALALNVGINTIDVKVTAEDGTTNKTYTITVNRAPSTNANLSALTVTTATLSPAFASATTSYTASVAYSTTSVTVTPTASDASATIQVRVNGGSYATVNSGSASLALGLNVGPNTIDVKVVASDGATIKTYTITVSRVLTSGNALNFDGANDYVSINNTIGNFGTGNFTIETWLRTTATSAIIIAKRNASNYGNFFVVGLTAGKLYMDIDATNAADYTLITGNAAINDGRWHQIAAIRSSGQLLLYVDGQLATTPVTINGNPSLSNTVTTTLGQTLSTSYLNGSLDEMRIWNTARSQSDVQANMFMSMIGATSGLLASYNFDATSGSTLTDQTGNGNNGTLINFALTGSTSNWVESYAMVVPTASAASSVGSAGFTANWTAPTVGTVTNYLLDISTSSTFASAITGSPFTVATGTTSRAITGLNPSTTYYYRVRADKTSVTGQGGYSATITTATIAIQPPGNALNFNTTNSVLFNKPFSTITDNFTLETWVNWNGQTTTQNRGWEIILINGNDISPSSGYGFQLNTNNGEIGYFMSGLDGRDCSTITPNKWYHVALVRKNGVATLFVNGVPDANTSYTAPNIPATSAKIGLYGFAGNIDEVRMWNVAKTQAQIQAAMFTALQGNEANLVSYYNFDYGTASGTNTGLSTLTDQTSNANNGTLTNFTLSGTTSNWVESYAMVIPAATSGTSITSTSFTANWSAPIVGLVDNYLLDVSTSSTFTSAITGSPFTVTTGTTSKTITALSPATTYYYRIRADKTSVTGQGGNSNTISVSTCSPTTSTTSFSSCVNYTWNGTTYTVSGIYTKTFTNAAGCDSIATLNLTIKQSSASSTTISNCMSYTWNGVTYTTSDIYTKTLVNAVGCDSIATLYLTIKQPTVSSTTISNCVSYTWNGTTYTTSGIYTKILVNAAGCDSVATLNLTIKQPSTSSTTMSNCGSYIWNGTTYTESGVYTKMLTNAIGCDSVATLNLTILQPTASTTTISNCESYTWNGTTYTSSGVYNETLTNEASCDSVATLNLTIKQPTVSTTTISNCVSYTWNDTTYTTSGIYNKTFINADGCDSLATLNLTIKQPTTSTTTVSNCASYTWNGMTYNTSGTYTMTLVNAAGCDSIATLNLTIKEAIATSTTINNCGNYIWNGTTYTASGVYTKTFTNAIGCDSVATLNLTIIQQTSSTTNVSNCVSYFFNGTTYTASGVYTQNLTNEAGCDSVATLNLTIKQPTASTTTFSSCVSYTWNGVTYDTSGIYTKTLVNAAGCDSVATLNLTIKQPTTSTTVISNCVSYVWNGTTYTTSGVYTKTFTNAAGCDSVATLNLTIKQPTTSTTNISSSVSYVWNGTSYSNSGIYNKTLSNAAGCDSVATLNLTIYQKSVVALSSTTNTTICSSELPYSWNGLIFNAAGTQTALLTNAQGLDSLATLVLTVTVANTASIASSVQSVCINTALTNIVHTTTGATGIGTATGLPTGVTAAWSSNIITISGTPTISGVFNYNIPLTGNCGNVAATGRIIVAALNTVSVASSTPVLCSNTALTNITHATTGATGIGVANGLPAGIVAAWANNTITISGTPNNAGVYSYIIPLTGNCGIINATGTITVKAASASTTNVSICPSELPYNWNGIRTREGTYTFITTNSVGCDSIATLNLTVKRSVQLESFDDIKSLASKGWVTINNSSPLGDSSWFQGNRDFSSNSGTGYIAANFESVGNNGNISNWLITPTTTLQNGNQISFYTRTITNPLSSDRIEVRVSTKGNSTNVGSSSDSVGDFTTVLLTVNPDLIQSGYPDAWKKYTITLDSLPAPIQGRIAFRYFVTDGGVSGINSDYIGIDDYAYSSLSTSKSTTNLSICPSALPYSWNGLTFTAAGSQTARLTNMQGCDSVATLNLTINQPSVSSTAISNCANYTWNGTTYTESGVYTKTLTNAVGCDSLATLILTIKQPTSSTTNVSSCVNYTWNGATYSTTGVYTVPFTNAAGCDSLAILNLTITQPTESITNITNCSNFSWNGETYSESGVYTKMLTNAAGCDSLAILNLNITIPTMSSTTISNCASYTWNGTTYTTSGVYTKILVNAAGCDSVATLNLTVKTTSTSTNNVSICPSELPYTWNGIAYNAAGIYTKTFTNAEGCDSVATFNLAVNQSTTNTKSLTGCNSVLYKTVTYTASTVVRDTVKSLQGCDSIYNVATIIVTPIIAVTIPVTLTGCNIVVYKSKTYTSSIIVRDTVKSVQGCDSIYNVGNITVNKITATTNTTNLSGCNSVVYKSKTYTATTTLRDTLKSYQGCDSIYNVATITITKPASPVITGASSVCTNSTTQLSASPVGASNVWLVLNTARGTITNTGLLTGLASGGSAIVQYSYTDINGCTSSSVTYNVFVNALPSTPSISTASNTFCVGNSYSFTASPTGGVWSSNNTAIANITSSSTSAATAKVNSVGTMGVVYERAADANGCKSTTTLSRTTTSIAITKTETFTGCNNVNYKSVNYTSSTVLRDTSKSVGGCDSFYYVANIVVTPVVAVTKTVVLSACNSLVYKNITYTSSTVLRDTVRSVQGCDSIYNITTIVITPIVAVTKSIFISNCNSVVYKGLIYNIFTILRDTVRSVQGCDSIYTITTINPIIAVINPITVRGCNSAIYKSKTYTVSTVVKDTTKSLQGCDSLYNIVTIIVGKAPSAPVISGPTTVCANGTTQLSASSVGITNIWIVLNSGRGTITNTGLLTGIAAGGNAIVNYSYIDSNSCTSPTASYNVFVNAQPAVPSITVTSTSFCVGNSYGFTASPSGGVWSSNNTAIANITSSTTSAATAKINGVGTMGVVYQRAADANGCKSSTTLTRTTTSVAVTKVQNLTNCKSVTYKSIIYTNTTVLRDTVKSVGGCDSIYNAININIVPIVPVAKTISLWGCNSLVYNNKTYNSSVFVFDTTKSSGGCDSVYNSVTITITPFVAVTKSVTLTGCKTVVYKGKTYSAVTILRDTVKSVQGCDSIYNITNISPVIAVVNPITLKGCNSIVYKSKTYTTTTVVRDTMKNVLGCDSIYNVTTLTVIKPTAPVITGAVSVCSNSTTQLSASLVGVSKVWLVQNSVRGSITPTGLLTGLSSGGNAIVQYNYTDSNGCTSPSAYYNVFVNALPTTKPTISSIATSFCTGINYSLSANQSNGIWTSDNAVASIVSTTTNAAVIKVANAGNLSITYQGTSDANGCRSSSTFIKTTTSCISKVNPIANVNNDNKMVVRVYPNPAHNIVTISINDYELRINNGIQLSVTDITGKVIKSQTIIDKQTKVNTTGFKPGIYLVTIQSAEGKMTEKLVVE